MKKTLLLMTVLLALTHCQPASTAEPVASKLLSLGRYTGWGWSYRGYNQTCNAFSYGVRSSNAITRRPLLPAQLESVGSLESPPYVTWLPSPAEAIDVFPVYGEEKSTSVANLPFEKRQIVQPTR